MANASEYTDVDDLELVSRPLPSIGLGTVEQRLLKRTKLDFNM